MPTSPTTRERALDALEASLDSDFLKALGEPVRVRILKILLSGGACDVSTIAEHLPQERSVISRHLKVLRDAGLVTVRRDGRRRVYALIPSAFVSRLESILESAKRCISVCCPG